MQTRVVKSLGRTQTFSKRGELTARPYPLIPFPNTFNQTDSVGITIMAAIQCFPTPSAKPCSAIPKKGPRIGFSLFLSEPSVPLSPSLIRTHARFQCKAVAIPAEQQWMFDETDFKGPDIWNKTWYPKAVDHVNTSKQWYIVDAADKKLGRLASTIAYYIRGKNLATYTPSVDMGSFVVVVNAEKVAVTGKKRTQKIYRRHSGRPGGMKEETFDQLQKRIPERIIEHAVRGMLPKGRLGRHLFNHLKVYKGAEHPHQAQKPIDLPIRDKNIYILS